MKKYTIVSLLISLLVLFFSCKNSNKEKLEKVKDSGKVIVENGKGEPDSINYKCVGCEKYIKDISILNNIIKESTLRTKNQLNFPLSFIPKNLELSVLKEDSLFYYNNNKKIENTFQIIAKCNYIAKNGYNNELEGNAILSFYLKDNKIEKIEDVIKLEKLEFWGKNINRNLYLISSNDNAFIEIKAENDKTLCIVSSFGYVSDNTWLKINFENDEILQLLSTNNYISNTNAWFGPLGKKDIKQLKVNKIKSVSFVDGEKEISCSVPINNSDYFIQLVNLYNK